jgi:hypothetical protein
MAELESEEKSETSADFQQWLYTADSTEKSNPSPGILTLLRRTVPIVAFLIILCIYVTQTDFLKTPKTAVESSIVQSVQPQSKNVKHVRAITWNLAAINNNPFEYWITNEDPNYNRIMSNVSRFIDSPGVFDVSVKSIFTEEMFAELEVSMTAANWTGVAETRILWDTDYKERKVISEFIKDVELGKKRLTSMPDRVTNSISTATEGVVMRPTVVNCYNAANLSSIEVWWSEWRHFVFEKTVIVKKQGVKTVIPIRDMISKIQKSKYPSITANEAVISIPLQTLCLAIFDAILVSMMNTIDGHAWQPLRLDICNKLNKKKTDRIIQILQTSYATADVQFLQEVASSFGDAVEKRPLANIFDIYYPAVMDSKRDQNSFILLKKGKFNEVTDVTSRILKKADHSHPVPVMDGDLLVLTAIDAEDGARYIFASFHGDTNGLSTVPVTAAVHTYALTKPSYKLLFGLDANTYYKPKKDEQGMVQFAEFFTSKKMNSCYGPNPNPQNFTTFNAHTHLQPQLNKAVRLEEKNVKGDKNPKDFILFFDSDFAVVATEKDNTGLHSYIENMVFPTLTFPSDHAVTSTLLSEKKKSSKSKTNLNSPVV